MAADERMKERMCAELRALGRVWMDQGATATDVANAMHDSAFTFAAVAMKCLQPGPGLTKARPR